MTTCQEIVFNNHHFTIQITEISWTKSFHQIGKPSVQQIPPPRPI